MSPLVDFLLTLSIPFAAVGLACALARKWEWLLVTALALLALLVVVPIGLALQGGM